MAKRSKCNCKAEYVLAALVLMSIGAYFIVGALATQLKGNALSLQTAIAVLPWYYIGFLVAGLGKMAKWQSHSECTLHQMK